MMKSGSRISSSHLLSESESCLPLEMTSERLSEATSIEDWPNVLITVSLACLRWEVRNEVRAKMHNLVGRSGQIVKNSIVTLPPENGGSRNIPKNHVPFVKNTASPRGPKEVWRRSLWDVEIQLKSQTISDKTTKRACEKKMINRFAISRSQNANPRSVSAPFLEIIPSKDCPIDDQSEKSLNFKRHPNIQWSILTTRQFLQNVGFINMMRTWHWDFGVGICKCAVQKIITFSPVL